MAIEEGGAIRTLTRTNKRRLSDGIELVGDYQLDGLDGEITASVRLEADPTLIYTLHLDPSGDVDRFEAHGRRITETDLRNVVGKMSRAIRAHVASDLQVAMKKWRKIVDDPDAPIAERWEARMHWQEAIFFDRALKRGTQAATPGTRRSVDADYAAVASVYVDSLRRGSRFAVRDTAAALGMPPTQQSWDRVRNQVAAARRRGLLTGGGRSGLQGGSLTPKGIAALEEQESDHGHDQED